MDAEELRRRFNSLTVSRRGGERAAQAAAGELAKASGPLSGTLKRRKGSCDHYQAGQAFRGVVPIRNADEDTVALSTNRKFLKIIGRSRSQKGRHDFGQRAASPFGTGKVASSVCLPPLSIAPCLVPHAPYVLSFYGFVKRKISIR